MGQECIFCSFMPYCYAIWYGRLKTENYFRSLKRFSLQWLPNFRAKTEFWAEPSPTRTILRIFFKLCWHTNSQFLPSSELCLTLWVASLVSVCIYTHWKDRLMIGKARLRHYLAPVMVSNQSLVQPCYRRGNIVQLTVKKYIIATATYKFYSVNFELRYICYDPLRNGHRTLKNYLWRSEKNTSLLL